MDLSFKTDPDRSEAMNRAAYLMFDLGTSSLKVVLYDAEGKILKQQLQSYAYSTPQPGWVEMDPADWEHALWEALDVLAADHDLSGITALSFTGQMHSLVMLDDSGETIRPCILWLDRRASRETRELQEKLGLAPYMLNSTYSLPRMYWLSRHREELVRKTRAILWPKDYIRYLMTGRIATDPTEGLGAGLVDWQTGAFDSHRLESIGWDPAVLPQVLEPDGDAGPLKADVVDRYGLNPEAKVLTGYGDILALLGGAPHKRGRLVYSFGSSSMFFTLAEEQDVPEGDHRLYRIDLAEHQLYGGVSSTTGAAVKWCFETIWREGELSDMIREALAVEPGSDGLIFLPYLAGERSPYWSDSIRGGFYGLQLEHRREHMARAVLEGIAMSIRHLVTIFCANGIAIEEIALAAGGVKAVGMPQLIADICGLPVSIYAGQETVTNMLLLMARCRLDGCRFREALADSFGEPVMMQPNLQDRDRYEEAFRCYLEFSLFADQQD